MPFFFFLQEKQERLRELERQKDGDKEEFPEKAVGDIGNELLGEAVEKNGKQELPAGEGERVHSKENGVSSHDDASNSKSK